MLENENRELKLAATVVYDSNKKSPYQALKLNRAF
jgi:hypothetical protein